MRVRMQGPQPDKLQEQNKRHKWPAWVRVVGFFLALLLIIAGATIWVLNSLGSLTTLLSTIFAALGVVLGLFQLVPLFFPARKSETSTTSTSTQPILVNIPAFQFTPSQTLMIHDQATFRGIQAMPPPTDPETILPREKDVQEVYARLTQPGATAIVLTGIAGIGKSTLAALVLNYVEKQRLAGTGSFSGDSIWLSIDEKTTFLDLAGNLFNAVEKPLPDFSHLAPQNQAAVLFNLLGTLDRSRLVVLDQFENLLDWETGRALAGRPGVSEWLDAINSQPCTCRILLTCRLWPESTRKFPPTCMQEYPVGSFEVSEGMELLRKQGVKAAQATDTELREAVMRFDAHALALSLLASILRHNRSLKLKDLFEEQTYAHVWLGDIARNLLDYIYKVQLDQVQRELLLAFSVFREPVRLEAAQALKNRIPRAQLLSALNVLLIQHLVQASEEGRYQLHAIVAHYASSHFNEKSERANQRVLQAMHAKAVRYYLQQAEKNRLLRNDARIMSDVQPFIEAIWHQCRAKQWRKAYGLAIREHLFADLRSWREYAVLLELCQLFLPEKRRLEPLHAALIYSNLAWACDELGKKKEALLYYEEALDIFRKLKDRWRQAETLNNLGGVYLALEEKEEALLCFEKALNIGREVWDRGREGAALNNLGGVYDELGEKEKALFYYEKSLHIRRDVGDRVGEDASLNNLGGIYLALGEKEKAISYYEEALYIRRDVGDRVGEAATLQSLGEMYGSLGEKEKAISYYKEAWHVRREAGDRAGEGVVLYGLGSIYKDLGQKEKALESYEEALHMKQEVGDHAGERVTLLSIGALYLEQAHYDVALAYFLLARYALEKIQSPPSGVEEEWMVILRRKVGVQQFATLLAKVEPQAQEIVEKSLREGAYT